MVRGALADRQFIGDANLEPVVAFKKIVCTLRIDKSLRENH